MDMEQTIAVVYHSHRKLVFLVALFRLGLDHLKFFFSLHGESFLPGLLIFKVTFCEYVSNFIGGHKIPMIFSYPQVLGY